MSLPMMVYLIGIMGQVSGTMGFLTFFGFMASLGYGLFCILGTLKPKLWLIVTLVSVVVFSGIIKTLLPTEKTAYMMVAAYATQKIYESPETAKIQEKVLTLINQKLDSFIEDKDDKKVDKE